MRHKIHRFITICLLLASSLAGAAMPASHQADITDQVIAAMDAQADK